MTKLNDISFWFDELADKTPSRQPLAADLQVDAVIIGAGYTGLWAAYYLQQQQPNLNIAIVEAEVVGFGASGRNGGWLMGEIEGQRDYLEPLPPTQRQAGYDAIYDTVDEVGRVCIKEQIDCDYHKGGTVYAAARYQEQLTRLKKTYNHYATNNDKDYQWLSKTELEQHVNMRGGLAGIYTPHCAAIQPAKLAQGLAGCIEAKGVKIFEQSRVTNVTNKTIFTDHGSIKADIIIAATEGFSDGLLNINKYAIPIQSHVIATEPLTENQWRNIGLDNRPTFSDTSRMSTYGQRSKDNRIVFGARGQYEFGGKVRSKFSTQDSLFNLQKTLLVDLFPSLENTAITHCWGGTLGMARKFRPYAIWDKTTGLANAGGYGGEGVGASNLFARTLVDMILERDTQLASMPWAFSNASHQSALKKWEPEPIRWLTYKAMLAVFNWEENVHCDNNSPPWQRSFAMTLADALETILS
jgi:glycine/D-amino acid oxidase-like deaminating enzyme